MVTYSMISTTSGSLSVSLAWSRLSSIRLGRPTASSSSEGTVVSVPPPVTVPTSSGDIVSTLVSYPVDGVTTATWSSAVSVSYVGSGSCSGAGIVMMMGAGGRVSNDRSLIVKPKAGDWVLPDATDAVIAI